MVSEENQELVNELNLAYVEELRSLQNYLSMGVFLEGVSGQGVIGESLLEDVEEEKEHAERLAERITELDGKPAYSSEDLEVSQKVVESVVNELDMEEAVESVIELERGAINRYNRIIEISKENGDSVTRHMAEELLADEEKHLDEFEAYLRNLE